MPGTITGPEAVRRSLILIDHVRSLAERHPNEIVLATTAAEVRAAHKAGKFAALMGMEGGHMIDDSLAVLRDYQRLGVRYLTLSHSVNTNWSDSSGDTPKHNGLTDFGKDVRPRTEPPRHARRHLARVRQDVLGRDGRRARRRWSPRTRRCGRSPATRAT